MKMLVVGAVVGGLLLGLVIATLTGTIVWFLWDGTMVEVFKAPSLTWWQAVKLSWICALLFKASVSTSKD